MGYMAEERAKFSIIDGAKYSLEEVQSAVSYNEERALDVHLPEVQKFLSYWDQVFLYGLKSVKKGYWPFVSQLSHPSLTRAVLSTPGAVNDLTRSRIWLASILNENSLECYLVIISTEIKLLNKFYRPNAILRTSAILQDLISISCGSENTLFSIHMDYICYHGNDIFINTTSDSEVKLFDTGLTLEGRSRSGSNVSIVSTRSAFNFKSTFESSRARLNSLTADFRRPASFGKSDSDEVSIGVEAELINSLDSSVDFREFGDGCKTEQGQTVDEMREENIHKEDVRIGEERTETEDKSDEKDKIEEKDRIKEKVMITEETSLCVTDEIDESELKERKWSMDYQESNQLIESMIIQEREDEMPSFSFDDVSGTPKSSPKHTQIRESPECPYISTSPRPIVPAITHTLQKADSPPCATPPKRIPTPRRSASPHEPAQSPRLDTPPNMNNTPQTPTKSMQCPQSYTYSTSIHSGRTSPLPSSPQCSYSPSRKPSTSSMSDSETGITRRKIKIALARIESVNVQPNEYPVTLVTEAEYHVDETDGLEEQITFDWRDDIPPVVDDPDDLSALLSGLTTDKEEREEEEMRKKEEEKRKKEEEHEKEDEVKEDEVVAARNDSSEFRDDMIAETVTCGETSSLLSISEIDQSRMSPYDEDEIIITTEDILLPPSPTSLTRSVSLPGSPCSYLSDISKTSEIEFLIDDIVEDVPFTNLGDQGQEILYEDRFDPYGPEDADPELYKECKSESDSSLDIIQPKEHSVTPVLEISTSITPVLDISTSNTQDLSIESEILHASIELEKLVLPGTPEEQISVQDNEEDRCVSDRMEKSSRDERESTDETFGEEETAQDAMSSDGAVNNEYSDFSNEDEAVSKGDEEQFSSLDQAHCSKDLPGDASSDDASDAPSFGSVEMDRAQADYQPPNNLLLNFSINVFGDEEQYKRMIKIWLKDDVGNLAVGYVMLSTAKTYLLHDDFSLALSKSYSSITSVLRSSNWQVLTLMFTNESREKGEIDIITGCEAISRGIMQGFMMYSTAPVMWSDEKSLSQCRLFAGVKKFIRSQAATIGSIDTDLYYVIAFWEPLKGEPPPKTDYPMTQGTLGLKEPTLLSYVWRDYYFILDGGKLHQMGLQCSSDVKKIYTIIGAEGCKHMKSDETTKKFAFKFKSGEGIEVMLNCKTEESLTRWMQVVCETAMEIPSSAENMGVSGIQCSVIICHDWLIVLREGLKSVYTLSATPLVDVSLVQWYPEENFCIITIADETREWLLLFRDAFETNKFLELLWDKWSNLFKLDDTAALFRKLSNNSDSLVKARSSMLKFRANWEKQQRRVILSF